MNVIMEFVSSSTVRSLLLWRRERVKLLTGSPLLWCPLQVPGNSLDDVVQSTGALQEPLVRRYIKQILLALEYCHSKGVLHRGQPQTPASEDGPQQQLSSRSCCR